MHEGPKTTRHTHGTASFLPPTDWRSVALFSAPVTPGARSVPTLSVTRAPRKVGDTLAQHADRLLASVRGAAPGFELVQTSDLVVDGRPARFVRFRLASEAGALEQMMVMVEPLGESEVLTFHTSGPRDASAEMQAMLENVLRSVRFAAPRAFAREPLPGDAMELGAGLAPPIPIPGYRVRR